MSGSAPNSLIRGFRTAKQLTQRQVAAAVGVSPAAVGQWETGTETPKRVNALALDEVLEANGAIAAALGYQVPVETDDAVERRALLERIDSLDQQVGQLTELIRELLTTMERDSAAAPRRRPDRR